MVPSNQSRARKTEQIKATLVRQHIYRCAAIPLRPATTPTRGDRYCNEIVRTRVKPGISPLLLTRYQRERIRVRYLAFKASERLGGAASPGAGPEQKRHAFVDLPTHPAYDGTNPRPFEHDPDLWKTYKRRWRRSERHRTGRLPIK